MAMKRFPLEQYASLELNQVAFPKTGMVVSQTPLGSEFTAAAPCENGMWVLADKSKGTIGSAAAVTDTPIGIVYTTEKEYDMYHYGLKTFGRKIEGDYPRVGILGLGDTVTTNCLQYDDSETGFTTQAALEATLAAYATTPVYVVLVAGSPVPKLTKTIPQNYAGPVGKVTKFYTVPNGEKGVKYEIVSL
jgi:hypothetical protein